MSEPDLLTKGFRLPNRNLALAQAPSDSKMATWLPNVAKNPSVNSDYLPEFNRASAHLCCLERFPSGTASSSSGKFASVFARNESQYQKHVNCKVGNGCGVIDQKSTRVHRRVSQVEYIDQCKAS